MMPQKLKSLSYVLLILCVFTQPAFSRTLLGISYPEKSSQVNASLSEQLEEASGNLITVHNYQTNKTLLNMLTKFRKLDAALISRQAYDQQQGSQLVSLGEVQVTGAQEQTTLVLAARADLTEEQEYQLVQGYHELIMSSEGLELLERYAEKPPASFKQVAALQAAPPKKMTKSTPPATKAVEVVTVEPEVKVEKIPEEIPVVAGRPVPEAKPATKPVVVPEPPKPVTIAQDKPPKPTTSQLQTAVTKKQTKRPKAVAEEVASQPWLPHVDLTAKLGNDRSLAEAELFVPLAQTIDSVLFLDLRFQGDDNDTTEGNFGLGYRRIVKDWIVGGYAFYDSLNSTNGNRFYQYTFGLEALTEENDLRLNVYLADDKEYLIASQESLDEILYSGNYLIHRTGGVAFETFEKAMSGFDAEIGWRLPWFKQQEVRGYLGGYHFTASDVEDVSGPRGRVAVRFNNIFNWPGSLFELGGEVRHDDLRDTDYFFTARARFPFNTGKQKHQKPPSGLSARMTERIQRDPDIIVASQHNDATTPINDDPLRYAGELAPITFTHIDANAVAGDGSLETPCNSLSCVNNGNHIILLYADSDFSLTNPVSLSEGQRLLGETGTHTVQTDQLGDVELPTITTGTNNPTLRDYPAGTAIELANGSEVSTIDIDNVGTAIEGINVGGVKINNTNIVNAVDGILLNNLTAYATTTVTSNTLDSISNDGIYLNGNDSSTLSAFVTDNTVMTTGRFGIHLENDGSDLRIEVNDNTITDAADTGIYMINSTLLLPAKTFSASLGGNIVSGSTIGSDGITAINGVDPNNVMSLYMYNNQASGDIANSGADYVLDNGGALFELGATPPNAAIESPPSSVTEYGVIEEEGNTRSDGTSPIVIIEATSDVIDIVDKGTIPTPQ